MPEMIPLEYVVANAMILLNDKNKNIELNTKQLEDYQNHFVTTMKKKGRYVTIFKNKELTSIYLAETHPFIKKNDVLTTKKENIYALRTRYQFLVDSALIDALSDDSAFNCLMR